MAEAKLASGCSTPGGDVSEMFQKMGAKLGWFQFKDIDSALESLSKSAKKKSTMSKFNTTKKSDKKKNKENLAGIGDQDSSSKTSEVSSKKHRSKKTTTKSCRILGENSVVCIGHFESEATCSSTNNSTKNVSSCQQEKLPKVDNSNGTLQRNPHVDAASVAPVEFVEKSASDRQRCKLKDDLACNSSSPLDLNNSVTDNKSNLFVIAGRPSVCMNAKTTLSDYCSDDIGVPVGESTRIHSRYSVSRLLSVTSSCEGSFRSESDSSLSKFSDPENDSYKLLNIQKENTEICNIKQLPKKSLHLNGNANTKYVPDSSSSPSDDFGTNLESSETCLVESSPDKENLYVTCSSSPELSSAKRRKQTEQFVSIHSSCSESSSYEVVDVSTQAPSVVGDSPYGASSFSSPAEEPMAQVKTKNGKQVYESKNEREIQKIDNSLSSTSEESLPDLCDNFENDSVKDTDTRQVEMGLDTDRAYSKQTEVVFDQSDNKKDSSQQWRNPRHLDDSSDDDLEEFFNKMKKRVVKEDHVNSEEDTDSMDDFIVDDDELSTDSDSDSDSDDAFYVKATREIDESEDRKKKNRSKKELPAIQLISDSSDEEESERETVQSPVITESTARPSRTPLAVASHNLMKKPLPPTSTYSFLRSLCLKVDDDRCDPEANRFKKNFKKSKEVLTKKLFDIYNSTVFDKQLPVDLPIIWNTRLLKTAGYCTYKHDRSGKTVRIELSTKVCDSTERVRDTLIHELCHAAVWLLNGTRDGHGPYWKYWARKANQTHREIPIIERCHSYSISTRFTYKCTKCGYSIGRHSKSLDTTKKVCGHCRGQFVLIDNKNVSSDGVMTSKTPRTPNKFALFVKENYGEVKSSGKKLSHVECMKLLSQQFAQKNKISD